MPGKRLTAASAAGWTAGMSTACMACGSSAGLDRRRCTVYGSFCCCAVSVEKQRAESRRTDPTERSRHVVGHGIRTECFCNLYIV